MAYTEEEVNLVYDRTGGRCFYCGKQLSFKNYGAVDEKGAWEIDHFIPRASYGAHQPHNWVPACVPCNTEKGDLLPWEYDPDRFVQGDRNPDNYLS
jgi:5-methylcytosine-specific restriction endonuclease McrA